MKKRVIDLIIRCRGIFWIGFSILSLLCFITFMKTRDMDWLILGFVIVGISMTLTNMREQLNKEGK
jgi:hypothetical protein